MKRRPTIYRAEFGLTNDPLFITDEREVAARAAS
jgi:hypothetical protein